ncbi:CACTA en-spm transposon protein [Cucumis melo var. makuwa]|uniref:CACTA en-spm transposon protein n=1 Tax=Cucumis melo var. makuwa TaxID=1194695 RepID=A0A5A7UK57_CUCMM|nr:CACTA en-spm transposon protein [Cucumis melo var. makuwa]
MFTTRKWSISDAEKHVGIKNVENKGFPDAVNNASRDASGKQAFPTHHEGVGKNTSGKGYGSLCSLEGFVGCEDILKYFVRLFVLDFNDQAMNRFVEHQMLTTFKEFRADYHKHFKKYSDPEEARANPPNALEQSRTNKAARQKQPYNHSSGSKSFLQRQYELAERRGQLVDRVELFRETHPTPKGSQPLSEDEICDQVLGRQPGYSKGLGWGPKPKARRTASASSSSTSSSQSTQKEIELQAKLHEALERIEVQDRNHQALASQVEAMKKMIEDLTRA